MKQSGKIKHLHVHAWICKCQSFKTLYVDQTSHTVPHLHLYSVFSCNGSVYRHFHLSTHKSNFRFLVQWSVASLLTHFPRECGSVTDPNPASGALPWRQWLEICTKTELTTKILAHLQSDVRCVRLKAFATKSLRTALFWVITQIVICSLCNNPEERSSPVSTKQFSQNVLRLSEEKWPDNKRHSTQVCTYRWGRQWNIVMSWKW